MVLTIMALNIVKWSFLSSSCDFHSKYDLYLFSLLVRYTRPIYSFHKRTHNVVCIDISCWSNSFVDDIFASILPHFDVHFHHCWRRSSRGHDHWLTYEQKLGNQSLLTSSPILRMYTLPIVPITRAISRMQPQRSNMWCRLSGLYMWLNPVKPSL